MSIETHPGDGGGGDPGAVGQLPVGVDQAANGEDAVEDPVNELDIETLRFGTGSYDDVETNGVAPATHSVADYDDDDADELLLRFPTDDLDLGGPGDRPGPTVRLVGRTHDGHTAGGETELGS